ncbi:tRNA 2-thiouridine(34) synthase MnmA [Candidatus Nomurabacteria bacterium RIFCSPHIGHO2_01_FULL_42_15]|uniref:tRNA-specific 2-thiouridylase MnmA n=1 Tax=Candidatus Nomurabacteria bacterium RIFCSPHIGHO2_01_FULL_42_15 TaxID=1801742 RepID=A0A1F6VG49_9BACT|nr:MAG: tRNA 2-thiouridine(34) synthase MnmA [Candidatus Nomurabacteria bacterium RIFCSPHIGHO2_01_FULL_42_15]OGI92957.1 MAG: tRNA 2-thiouridine(34) synthase MnmA [Candidatus Nomurabacteria bacterium RIFCSPLOWO2_01_FULL_41_18]
MRQKTVFIGLSGGVDSAVSVALLKKEGYEVVGVFIKTWHPDFLSCNEEEERRDAMRVAAHLNIPFLTFDFEDVYKKEVADYMISEYKKGRTPNPDVMCNKEVKFGAFLKKALAMGADFVATGHYAEISQIRNVFSLKKSPDPSKDQSYFLWTLTQEQLAHILFPIGHFKKTEVRKLAKKFALPVAEKKDSQGICFLGDIDLKDFLRHYIKTKRGKVLNTEGKEIGHHEGAVFNTLGERHGFTITEKNPNDGPYYVIGKDVKKNVLIVSQEKKVLSEGTDIFLQKNSSFSARRPPKVLHKAPFSLVFKNTNWISKSYPLEAKSYVCQIRYHGEFLPCKIKAEGSKRSRRTQVIFNEPVLVAAGQSCVIFDGNICLGGGVVV